jgi:hypothetical protein
MMADSRDLSQKLEPKRDLWGENTQEKTVFSFLKSISEYQFSLDWTPLSLFHSLI